MSQLHPRRQFLKLSVLGVGAALPSACYRATTEPEAFSEEASARFFPQSVASGDPRPDSVVLWVRALDPERPAEDSQLELILARDEALTDRLGLSGAQVMVTTAETDHCLMVRIGGLEPGTTYYYRFLYQQLEGVAQSRIGRTRTAPTLDSEEPVRFAVMSCQDYVGKYFHVARHLSEQDVDFVLHLGDYVYETTGDPSFQSASDERQVTFSAPEDALELSRGGAPFLAAQSLSNYRDLYKTYRSDPDLQALHERHPIIAMWDDHEFSDDCHGYVSTYADGTEDEASPARRASADRAWSEYMPVDYTPRADAAVASKLDRDGKFPDNFTIYRSFLFGQHLELVLTDLRRFRPDHLVPEDAAPGAVFLTAADAVELFDEPPPDLVPYVDLESFADGAYQAALSDNAEALGITADSLAGDFSAVWINGALASLSGSGLPEPIDLEDSELPRGYAYHSLLKSQQFSRVGSRYAVAVRPFEALAAKLWKSTEGQSENLMGPAQREWFLSALRESKRTFKVWGSEICFQSRHIDLSEVAAAPPELRTRISISAEDWDGFPNERRALLKELSAAGNVVVLSGDLHCFLAGTPFVEGDEETRVVELTTSSVSSTTWKDGIASTLSESGMVPAAVAALAQNIELFLGNTTLRPNPHLAYQDLARNGYSVLEVGPRDILMTVHSLASKYVATAPKALRQELDDLFETETFRTRKDSAELEREENGEFLTWSRAEMSFQ
ncbi:MAG: alkaline phosphatase [Myxococcales bacterium]|nr:MAG: alkaline phosphatase [Myxococcales bacterium]